MNYCKTLTYAQVKANIEWMILFYSKDLLEDPKFKCMTLDELSVVYEMNEEMVNYYQGCLFLLECEKLLGLI